MCTPPSSAVLLDISVYHIIQVQFQGLQNIVTEGSSHGDDGGANRGLAREPTLRSGGMLVQQMTTPLNGLDGSAMPFPSSRFDGENSIWPVVL